MRIRLCGQLVCTSEAEAHIVRDHLPSHVALTRVETGCLSFEVSQSSDPLVWLVEELFEDAAAFAAHQKRMADSDWGRETAGITRLYSIEELRD